MIYILILIYQIVRASYGFIVFIHMIILCSKFSISCTYFSDYNFNIAGTNITFDMMRG
ncbi:hypothetical protein DET57_11932 [Klebsiella oxytoca]|uniref:Uncharacterized protein n=1 Tax=Klebsiella oxytoca TaxID=571 RepID=A0A318FCY2_KLEOX|nr:hypothetical protein DET57_11932 [Klebsiella oxytoca]